MAAFIVRRLIQATLVMLVVALIAFLLPRVKGAVVGVMWNLGLKGDEYQ